MESIEPIVDQPLTDRGKRATQKAKLFPTFLDKSLFLLVAIMLLFTVALLSANLAFQHQNYRAGISAALMAPNIDHAVVISYTRAWDFAITKISSVFLAFCLILIGALYVLRSAKVSYSLAVANSAQKSSLETGSPGLVMITLGVLLMAIVMFSTSRVEYHGPSSSPVSIDPQRIPPDEATTPNEHDPKTPTGPKQGEPAR